MQCVVGRKKKSEDERTSEWKYVVLHLVISKKGHSDVRVYAIKVL